MPDDFDEQAAKDRHYRIMDRLVWAKNRIDKTTDYYYDYPPKDDDSQKEVLRSARAAALEARDELNRVLAELE